MKMKYKCLLWIITLEFWVKRWLASPGIFGRICINWASVFVRVSVCTSQEDVGYVNVMWSMLCDICCQETLMDVLERKMSVLRQQKQLLQQEIADNKELGLQVSFCEIRPVSSYCCDSILYSVNWHATQYGIQFVCWQMLTRQSHRVRGMHQDGRVPAAFNFAGWVADIEDRTPIQPVNNCYRPNNLVAEKYFQLLSNVDSVAATWCD